MGLSTGVYNQAAYNKGLFCYLYDYSRLLRRLILLGFSGAPKRRNLLGSLKNWEVSNSINSLNHDLSTGPVDVGSQVNGIACKSIYSGIIC
jgi:hypothetical protein